MSLDAPSSYRRQPRPLSVFVPLVHALRAMGMARSLRRAGHLMYLNAPSSVGGFSCDAKITQADAQAAWGSNVRCYEGREIFDNPPDVMIVGAEGLEPEALNLWRLLSEHKPVVLCALSGCYQSRFDWTAYRGHICADPPSRALARYHDVPAIRYYELFEPSDYPYLPWQPSDTFVLPTFVVGFAARFPLSAEFHSACAEALRQRFGSRVRAEVIEGRSAAEVHEILRAAPAVLAIKDQEGYGWSILEALSTGRPILYQAGLLRGMEFHRWTEPGVSGLGFVTPDDLVRIVEEMLEDPDALRTRQERTAAILRERYDAPETGDDLNAFLEDLVRLEQARWRPHHLPAHQRRAALPYQPSLDPGTVQDWERVVG